MGEDGFFPDKGRSVERSEARRLAREARIERDRDANAASIREQIEDGTAGVGRPAPSCTRCGDPFAALKDGLCPACQRERNFDHMIDKMSPEELYPEHFENEREESE